MPIYVDARFAALPIQFLATIWEATDPTLDKEKTKLPKPRVRDIDTLNAWILNPHSHNPVKPTQYKYPMGDL